MQQIRQLSRTSKGRPWNKSQNNACRIESRVLLTSLLVMFALSLPKNASAATPASLTLSRNTILSGDTVVITGSGLLVNYHNFQPGQPP